MRRFAGALFEHRDEFRVRCKASPSGRIELGEDRQQALLYCSRSALAPTLGQQAQALLQAPRSKLVHVGVPRGRHWNTQLLRKQSAHETNVVRSGDVQKVGLELDQLLLDATAVAQQKRVDV